MKNSAKISLEFGAFKNFKISCPDPVFTRPSKAILRGSLMDSLRFFLPGKIFIEAFAGSGSIGLCALSLGAKKSIFIEKNPAVFRILNQNLTAVKNTFPDFCKNHEILPIFGDAFSVLREILPTFKNNVILYFDPPFLPEIYKMCAEFLGSAALFACEKIIFEAEISQKLAENFGNFVKIGQKNFGKSALIFYERRDKGGS